MAEETQRELLIRIDERTEQIPLINRHLEKLNGEVASTNVKLAKANEIACNAQEKATSNRRYIDKLVIAFITSSVALIIAIATIIIQVI